MSDSVDEVESEASFALLNAYLEDLHAGRTPNRDILLAKHPELAQAIDCLDAIDHLVPSARSSAAHSHSPAIHSVATQIPSTQDLHSVRAVDRGSETPALGDFGDYDLICEIGRGGMGVVYRAQQKSLDRLVAVKMILASHLASAEQVQRFRTEAKAAAKVCHPNIVGIHEIGELHGQHYFVMEHVEGRSLSQMLDQGPMDPEAAAACVAKIARAVHHLHMHGIVHRDLKPSNVLTDSEGEPHLTDFGLAKTLFGDSHMTHAGAIVGTPSYMSPEQASGRVAEVGPSSDIYSLGALLYDLITGRPPFRESTPLDTLVQVLEGEPRLPSELNPRVPSDLELICLRCLEKVPELRYKSADELADDLERFLKGETVEARPPNVLMRVRRWSRREPALASRLAVLALCVAIVQVNYWHTKGSPDRVDPRAHLEVMLSLGVWAIASFCFQQLVGREKWSEAVRYAWAATDALLLTLVLWLTDTIQSPVVVGYPALIAASGLWFRHRLVWFMTVVCCGAYLLLMLDWRLRGQRFEEPLFRHIILLVVLVGVGSVVAYQVKRIRALSRHYAQRHLP
jgi:serine/threonine-protein kinase